MKDAPSSNGFSRRLRLLPSQLRMIQIMGERIMHSRISQLFEIQESLTPTQVEEICTGIYRRHAGLRERFAKEGDEWTGFIVDDETPFTALSLVEVPPSQQIAALGEHVVSELRKMTSLQSPLVRFAHFTGGPNGKDHLLAITHHLIVDGQALDVVFEDLVHGWKAALGGARPTFEPTEDLLSEWTLEVSEAAQVDPPERFVAPIESMSPLSFGPVAGAPAVIVNPTEDARGWTCVISRMSRPLPAEIAQRRLNPFDVSARMTTAYVRTLSEFGKTDQIFFEFNMSSRLSAPKLEGCVGFLTSFPAVVVEVGRQRSLEQQLAHIEQELEELFESAVVLDAQILRGPRIEPVELVIWSTQDNDSPPSSLFRPLQVNPALGATDIPLPVEWLQSDMLGLTCRPISMYIWRSGDTIHSLCGYHQERFEGETMKRFQETFMNDVLRLLVL